MVDFSGAYITETALQAHRGQLWRTRVVPGQPDGDQGNSLALEATETHQENSWQTSNLQEKVRAPSSARTVWGNTKMQRAIFEIQLFY